MAQNTSTKPWRFSQILSPAPLKTTSHALTQLQTFLYSPSIYTSEEESPVIPRKQQSPVSPCEDSPILPHGSYTFSDASADTAINTPVVNPPAQGAYPSPYQQRTFFLDSPSEASFHEPLWSPQPATVDPVLIYRISSVMPESPPFSVSEKDHSDAGHMARPRERSDENLLSESIQLRFIEEHDYPYYPLQWRDQNAGLSDEGGNGELRGRTWTLEKKELETKSPIRTFLAKVMHKLPFRESK